ncbi:MAG TPA: 30S ribosomal protein S16 [Firmicutes bacterium]|jgi:small subunit ribosomal protein S16|nr:30S ribosomal protein S16 [Bacillota bacterium]
MAVRIRLRRMGAKKAPFYRLVVADSRMPRDGRFIDIIGYYNPTTDPAVVKVDEEKALDWLGKGAQPSETVRSLFKKAGIMEKFTELKNRKQA